MDFKLTSQYQPTGDQPQAIRELVSGLNNGDRAQVLLGVTGSGKTFTMANVIAQVNRPTLILTHKQNPHGPFLRRISNLFPDNAVEYFVSYYDYYQPEAYISVTDTYIEKDLQINELVDKLRLKATSTLLSAAATSSSWPRYPAFTAWATRRLQIRDHPPVQGPDHFAHAVFVQPRRQPVLPDGI